VSSTTAAPASHANWFDHLRLALAALVLLSHASELVDGDRHREILTRIFGTCTFGEAAVIGFLVLSGYLIARAWLRTPRVADYLKNRVLRIAPAFLVAFAVSVFVIGAFCAASPTEYFGTLNWSQLAFQAATLGQPTTPPTFPGQPYPIVNGSLWTIQLEFFCYLLAPFACTRRWSVVVFWLLAAAGTEFTSSVYARGALAFMSGAAYSRLGIGWNRRTAWICAVVLPISLFFHHAWAMGLSTAGAYLLLGLGSKRAAFRLGADISYGLYLYGWPVQQVLIHEGLRQPLLVFGVSLAIAGVAGAASWYGLERFALRLKRAPARRSAADDALTTTLPPALQ
jgi:peptidoglycan/LPS O-acetylase OafA/YrhL